MSAAKAWRSAEPSGACEISLYTAARELYTKRPRSVMSTSVTGSSAPTSWAGGKAACVCGGKRVEAQLSKKQYSGAMPWTQSSPLHEGLLPWLDFTMHPHLAEAVEWHETLQNAQRILHDQAPAVRLHDRQSVHCPLLNQTRRKRSVLRVANR